MSRKREFFRQFLHMLIGSAIVLLYWESILLPIHILILILAGAFLSYLSLKTRIPVLSWFLERFERKEDLKTFPGRGPIMMLVGMLLSIKLFPRDIALGSMSILAIGDGISHVAGITIGKSSNPFNGSKKKFLEGTLAGIFTSFIAALPFLRWDVAMVAAVSGMIGEAMDMDMNGRPVNDNIAVPLIAGTFALLYSNGMLMNLLRF